MVRNCSSSDLAFLGWSGDLVPNIPGSHSSSSITTSLVRVFFVSVCFGGGPSIDEKREQATGSEWWAFDTQLTDSMMIICSYPTACSIVKSREIMMTPRYATTLKSITLMTNNMLLNVVGEDVWLRGVEKYPTV